MKKWLYVVMIANCSIVCMDVSSEEFQDTFTKEAISVSICSGGLAACMLGGYHQWAVGVLVSYSGVQAIRECGPSVWRSISRSLCKYHEE